MTTTENNKLINNFLGVISEYETSDPLFNITYNYHNDWNWLMQVVEKIESLDYEVEMKKQFCSIGLDNLGIAHSGFSNSKIKAVYDACVKFIKWYNNNNK